MRGELSCCRATNVALIMLCGLDVPTDFATMSLMPSVSNTARIGPPAMMPVPAGAARKVTLPAPKRPLTSWCSGRPGGAGRLCRLRRLGDRPGAPPRLAGAVADPAALVTDHHDRREGKSPSA